MLTLAGTETAALALESEIVEGAVALPVSVTRPVARAARNHRIRSGTQRRKRRRDHGRLPPELDHFEVARASASANAGFRMSLFQRVSKVPVMYMSEPLSATMRPYRCIARKIFCTLASPCAARDRAVHRLLEPQPRAHRQRAGSRAGAVRRRIDVAVGRPHRDAERVADLRDAGRTPRRSGRGPGRSRAPRHRRTSRFPAGGRWCSGRRTRRNRRATCVPS